MSEIVILGAGSWGTALAVTLARKEIPVTIWCRNIEHAKQIRQEKENAKYLPGVSLPDWVKIVDDLDQAIVEAKYIILAVPSQSVRETIHKIKENISNDALLVNTAKGLEAETGLRLSEVVEQEYPAIGHRFVALYGPSHAEEVGQNLPTVIVAACYDINNAEKIQDLFMSPTFRVYTNTDLIGVEIGGALKNVVALATGISMGLGFGDNAQAGLLTRGMTEIARLGVALGADVFTFTGLTGIGDLVVTCTSVHSRNRRAGIALGQGKKLSQILDEMGMVVEGVKTTKAAVELARRRNIPMPISEEMYQVLFHDVDVKVAVSNLMSRNKKSENEKDFLGKI